MLETRPSVEPLHDANLQETGEWLEALEQIVDEEGPERASFLLKRLLERGANWGVTAPLSVNTPYLNTIPADAEEPYPGDREIVSSSLSLISG
jgi:pyruvate dehydrogenase E1 component